MGSSDALRAGALGLLVFVAFWASPVQHQTGAVVALGRGDAQARLGEGWGAPEGEFHWTVAPRAELYLAPEGLTAGVLRLKMHPNLGGRAAQRLFVSLNGETAATLTLRDAAARVYTVPLPAGLRGSDRITFDVPDAAVSGADTRRLGVALHWLRLDAFPALARGRPLDLGSAEGDAFLGEGWGEREGSTRWTAALVAEVVFAANPATGTRLVLVLAPFLHRRLPAQRVRLELNGQALGERRFERQAPPPWEVVLPPGSLQEVNVLRLAFPDARSPAAVGLNADRRLLGVRVGSLELR